MAKKFTLTKTVSAKLTAHSPRGNNSANDFVQGKEPTRAKTFNIPIRLADQLRIIAAKRRQTDTDIIVGLIDQFVRENVEDAK
ncbi:MAG: hypothetical protein FJ147_18965 [Deltaproteobacteria bacterium]|nr:hypothetical protein [Deltaproteobacteria bacterium]